MEKMKTLMFSLILVSMMIPLVMFSFMKRTYHYRRMSHTVLVPTSFNNVVVRNNISISVFKNSVEVRDKISVPIFNESVIVIHKSLAPVFNNSVKVWHAVSLPNLSDNITGYTADLNVRKYVIYLCDGSYPCGGWADRQKGIVSSFVLAQALGRKFKVQITYPCELSAHLLPKNIEWRIKPDELKNLSKIYIKILDNKANKLRREMVMMDLESRYPQDIIYFTSNMEYSQYLLRNKKYKKRTQWMAKFNLRQLYVYLLEELFQFVPQLEEMYQNFSSSIARNNGSRFLCAQVRLGRNPTVPSDSNMLNSLKNVSAVWDFFTQFKDLQKHQIFVTSDSEQVRQNARKLFLSNILDTNGKIVHIEHYGEAKEVCDGFNKVLLDQRVLSLCDVLVISRSGFALIGAWLRRKTDNLYCFSKGQVKSCHPDHLGYLFQSW